MTAAPQTFILNTAHVAQLSGDRSLVHDPLPSIPVRNATRQVDFFAGDIFCFWDMLDGRVAVGVGDWWPASWGVSGWQSTATAPHPQEFGTAAHIIHPSFGITIAITALNGTQSLYIDGPANDINPAGGLMNAYTGVGPEGWAAFSYTSAISSGFQAWILNGCKYVLGGGTITPGMALREGEPRPGGIGRGNAIGVSSQADITSGFDDLTFGGTINGRAGEAIPFTHVTTPRSDIFPGTVPANLKQIERVWREADGVHVRFYSAHGFTDPGWGYKHGLSLWIVGIHSVEVATDEGTQPSVLAANFTLTVATGSSTAGLATTGSIGEEKQVTVPTTNGDAVISYTVVNPTTITNCNRVSGGTGTVLKGSAGGRIRQGVPGLNNTIQQIATIVGTVGTSREITLAFGSGLRAGGLDETFSYAQVPANADAANPHTATRGQFFPIGGFAVPRAGSFNGQRQFVFLWNGKLVDMSVAQDGSVVAAMHTALELWYSDADIASSSPGWTYGFAFPAQTDMNSPYQAAWGYYDAGLHQAAAEGHSTPYVYAGISPSGKLLRVDPANPDDVLNIANWQGWNSAGPAWGSIAAATHLGWDNGFGTRVAMPLASGNGGVIWMPYFSEFIWTYGVTNARATADLRGTWGPNLNKVPTDALPAPPPDTLGITYSGYPDPRSGRAPNPVDTVYVSETLFGPYNGWSVKNRFSNPSTPAGVDPNVVDVNRKDKYGPDGSIEDALVKNPTLESLTFWSNHSTQWEWVSANSFRIAGAALDPLIKKRAKVSFHDGTATRYAIVKATPTFASGFTTVVLISHDDGATPGNIALDPGVGPAHKFTACRYTYAADAPGWPDAFLCSSSFTVNGFSGTAPTLVARYFAVGTELEFEFNIGAAGTSNASTKTLTGSPVAMAASPAQKWGSGYGLDNNINGSSWISMNAGATTFNVYFQNAIGTWTASGNCRFVNSIRIPF